MGSYQTRKRGSRTEAAPLPILAGRLKAELSQEDMAEALNVDPRTLRRYESGELPTPDDIMLTAVEIFGEPFLLYRHFKEKYGIPDSMMPTAEPIPLAVAAINLLRELDHLERGRVASRLLELADDGIIDPEEEKDYSMIMEKLDGVRRAVELLRYYRRD